MKSKAHWYFFHMEECVLCGRDSTYRERRYTRKPKDPNKRFSFSQYACCEHFM